MRGNNHGQDHGLSLIELLIAIFVLAIGTVAAVRTLDQAGRAIGGETARYLAYNQAANRMAEIRLMGVIPARTLPGRVTEGPYDWQVDVTETPTASGLVEVRVQVAADNAPGALLMGYVLPGASP